MTPVSTQPLPNSMSAYSVELHDDEKSANQCQIHLGSKGQCSCTADSHPARHRACHQARLRRLLLPIALLLLAVGATLVISCVSDIDLFDLVNLGADVSGSPLGKRQSTGSSFTENKCKFISKCTTIVVVVIKWLSGAIDYLIVIFVGLFLVLIAGIMLSFWCCRGKVPSCQDMSRTEHSPNLGSFENPLCCPCYLCACCGGLGKLFPFQLHGCRLLCVVSLFGVHWMWIVCGWTGGCLMQFPGWQVRREGATRPFSLDMSFFLRHFPPDIYGLGITF